MVTRNGWHERVALATRIASDGCARCARAGPTAGRAPSRGPQTAPPAHGDARSHRRGGLAPCRPRVAHSRGARWRRVPITLDQVHGWVSNRLGGDHVVVRPVLDPIGQTPVDAYEIPARIRESLHVLHPFEVPTALCLRSVPTWITRSPPASRPRAARRVRLGSTIWDRWVARIIAPRRSAAGATSRSRALPVAYANRPLVPSGPHRYPTARPADALPDPPEDATAGRDPVTGRDHVCRRAGRRVNGAPSPRRREITRRARRPRARDRWPRSQPAPPDRRRRG